MAQETTSAASYGEKLMLHEGEKQKLLHCQKGAKNDRSKVITTRLTSRLQRCDPKKSKGDNVSCFLWGNTIAP